MSGCEISVISKGDRWSHSRRTVGRKVTPAASAGCDVTSNTMTYISITLDEYASPLWVWHLWCEQAVLGKLPWKH